VLLSCLYLVCCKGSKQLMLAGWFLPFSKFRSSSSFLILKLMCIHCYAEDDKYDDDDKKEEDKKDDKKEEDKNDDKKDEGKIVCGGGTACST